MTKVLVFFGAIAVGSGLIGFLLWGLLEGYKHVGR